MSTGRVEIKIEDPGNTEEVEVVEVMVEVGSNVTAGAPLMEVATDKANADVESPADGTVVEILVSVGDIVPVDQVLAILET